jgi:hypothetical protein
MEEFIMERIFYCYSKPLKDFLVNECKIRYFSKGKHDKTNKKFWMFCESNELNKNLTVWKSRKLC